MCTAKFLYAALALPAIIEAQQAGPGPAPGPPVWPGPPPAPPPLPPPVGPESGCSADQIKAHCTQCGDSKCTACAPGYGVNTDGTCIAACLLPGYSKQLPPQTPGVYHGIQWVDECIDSSEDHFFGIGDWGGIRPGEPAPNTHGGRHINKAIDYSAQQLVADVMNAQAEISKPKFVLNVGDNFYWGGLDWIDHEGGDPEHCGDFAANPSRACTHYRFQKYYDDIYNGPALKNAPWFSVLGNHDWGGYEYETGWDGQIYKTFCRGSGSDGYNRWRMPGLYWRQKVQFRDFSVDIFMLDGNAHDVLPGDSMHNICQQRKSDGVCNVPNATMRNEHDCSEFLHKMWEDGMEFLKAGLATSDAEWQIAVTHYPPSWSDWFWKELDASNAGLDLIVTGHTHVQSLHVPDGSNSELGIPWLITGGGGGITSEGCPNTDGHDDEYGFVDFTINKDTLKIDMHSHGGPSHASVVRRSATISPKQRQAAPVKEVMYI